MIYCGDVFCDACGDCIACYGDEYCMESSDGQHSYVDPDDDEVVDDDL